MTVDIYTDGSRVSGDRGGWAAVIPNLYELSGRERNTTNNRMELTAAIEALHFFPPGSRLHVYSDSQYVVNGITKWIRNWKRKSFEKIKNVDLWLRLDNLNEARVVEWEWVKAHNGNKWNERADVIARQEAVSLPFSTTE